VKPSMEKKIATANQKRPLIRSLDIEIRRQSARSRKIFYHKERKGRVSNPPLLFCVLCVLCGSASLSSLRNLLHQSGLLGDLLH